MNFAKRSMQYTDKNLKITNSCSINTNSVSIESVIRDKSIVTFGQYPYYF